jgi:hypothetical protein
VGFVRSRFGAAVVTGVLVAALASGVTWASIPNSTSGVITACYSKTLATKTLRVIDAQAGQKCTTSENKLSWQANGLTLAQVQAVVSAAPGRLIYQNYAEFQGPWDGTTTKASFTVPAGLMCVWGQASAYTTTAGASALSVQFANGAGAPGMYFNLEADEANSHKALVPLNNNGCETVSAGTYKYVAYDLGSTSDSNDWGSIQVQVFSQ